MKVRVRGERIMERDVRGKEMEAKRRERNIGGLNDRNEEVE